MTAEAIAIVGAAVAPLAVLVPLLLSIRAGVTAQVAGINAQIAGLRTSVDGIDTRLRAVEIEIARLDERVAHLGERVVRIESALTGPYRLPVPEPERDAPPAEPAPAREAART